MTEQIKKKKLPYDKPNIEVIELAADEVLATGCKTGVSGSGGKGSPAVPPNSCISPGCSTLGS
jgi:hypothetical protein